MQTTQRPTLVFWFSAPPKVGRGAFNFAADHWGARVVYACHTDYRESRRTIGWDEGHFGGADIEFITEQPDPAAAVDRLIREDPAAIHVFAGFEGAIGTYLDRYLQLSQVDRAAVFSERPGVYGTLRTRALKRIGVPIRHRGYYRKYGQRIRAFMPLGQLGCVEAMKYGWQPEQLYPFMYCPDLAPGPESVEPRAGEPVRLLYVGRFSRFTKGTDTLLKAIDRMRPGTWQLDLVGGYGDYAANTIAWAADRPNVNYLGPWPASEVSERMRAYDVCVIPSRFDGWNVVVNEAINAGAGIVSTDEAVSHEVVTAADAGLVVPASDDVALARALQAAVDDRVRVDRWRANAIAYAPRIAPPTIGGYLMDVLDFAFLGRGPRPECQWL